MKIYPCDQGGDEWLQARLGKVTASEFDQLITPLFEGRTGDMPKTYLAKKIAETVLRRQVADFDSWATDQGTELEMEARAWFAFEYPQHRVKQVGFIESDDGRCGCSPDGLIDDDSGLELKCPQPVNHVRYLIDGKLPKDYAAQVHFSMFITGRPSWMFVSYRRKFRPFVLRVERDEEKQAAIRDALAKFYERFDAELDRITLKGATPPF